MSKDSARPGEIRDLAKKTWEVPELPERYLLDLRSECNLACPMCLLHGSDDDEAKEGAIGKMEFDQATQILDEIKEVKPLIQPSMWGEPLLAKNLRDHLQNMKDRGISVCMNTNGLTLREPLARFFVEVGLDSIFFSLDSTTPETLKKVRGVNKLQKIEDNLRLMLRVREEMGATMPRIGATFTVQDENEHELEEFIDKWVQEVDVVRVGTVFEDGGLTGISTPQERVPCGALYHTMPIHFDGNVSICCFDSFATEIVGNVFTDGGVKGVWHGDKLNKIRHYHETNQYDKVPFCKDCNAWAGYVYEEEVTKRAGVAVLERRSHQFVYYNRLDRMDSWHENLRGHEPPDFEALEQIDLDEFVAEEA
jgi:radical SAM protein with 4Fe4S-binding SPASM domain